MYYEVVSRGNIVHSGLHFAHHVNKRSVDKAGPEETSQESNDENNPEVLFSTSEGNGEYLVFQNYDFKCRALQIK